jgi:hypothetical protein
MANNIVKGNGQFLTLKVLNSLSPQSFSFTISVGKEGFINPFLKLLNSPGRNAKISQSNS